MVENNKFNLKKDAENELQKQKYAYVAQDAGSTGSSAAGVYKCGLTSTGTFSSCSKSPTSSPSTDWTPGGITFAYSQNGIQYAYIVDYNGTGLDTTGHIYQCNYSTTTGVLSGCTATPSGQGWSPASISFATSNGTSYAYVADAITGYIYKCNVTTSGGLSGCAFNLGSNSNFYTSSAFTFTQ